jgi:hypothetical protein
MGAKLVDWNKDGGRGATFSRLRDQLAAVCAKLPPQAPERSTCNGAFAPAAARDG